MRKKTILMSILFTAIVVLSGCTYGGAFASVHQTNVELSDNTFQIIATDVKGEASSAHVLGATFSTGFYTETLALLRVEGTGMLYQEALSNLWKNVEEKYGNVEGKSLALINVRYDADCLNLILYTHAKVVVRADVVQF